MEPELRSTTRKADYANGCIKSRFPALCEIDETSRVDLAEPDIKWASPI